MNYRTRTIFIGDVHGCFDELEKLLNKLDLKGSERLIFVGDLINKGPHSFKVLNKVRSIAAEVILGNHEIKFLEYLKSGEDTQKDKYQCFKPLKEQITADKSFDWVEYISSFPLYIEEKDFLCVHAGIDSKLSLAEQPKEILTQVRELRGKPWHELYDGEKKIIYGHWSDQGLMKKNNSIGLDTGCWRGGQLTAFILEEEKIIQVSSSVNLLT